MEAQDLSSEALATFLETKIRVFGALSEADRLHVLAAVRDHLEKRLPSPFILSSARALSRRLAEEEEEAFQPPDSERQKFIEENALSPEERVSSRSQPRSEAKTREREEFVANVRRLLREARSAKQPHERRKMRRELLGIDQNRLRRALGNEGRELSEQIRELLLRSNDLR